MLDLSERADGFGFYYGSGTGASGHRYSVNLLPPEEIWEGDIKPKEICDLWVALIDGQTIAKTETVEEADQALRAKLKTL
ncbi:MAG: hypothetical protein AAFQ90_09555 [Pseudomonadota bacterium]